MEALNADATKDSPRISLNPETGECEITGRSFPEDCNRVYDPVLDWLEEYKEASVDHLRFRFDLDYISSTSYIFLLKIILKLKELEPAGKKTSITWNYESDDEDIRIAGEKFIKATGMEIDLVAKD